MTRISVVLTQAAGRAAAFAAALRSRGFDPREWPLTQVGEVPGLDWGRLAGQLAGCRWVLLPSPGAVDVVMAAFLRQGLSWPTGTGLGVVGPGSEAALRAWQARVPGLQSVRPVVPLAAPYDAGALLARPEFASLRGVVVAVLRRADGREAWLDVLRERGAVLHAVSVYTAASLDPPEDAATWLAQRALADDPVVFTVASAEAGARLAGFVAGLECARWALGRRVLTQHPAIAARLAAFGWTRVSCHAPGPTGLLAALESAEDGSR